MRDSDLSWTAIFMPKIKNCIAAGLPLTWVSEQKDSRLAREIIVALPRELPSPEWQALLTDYIQDNFVSDGMCADVCIHDTDGHNPHAHIMLTVRPLDKHGKMFSVAPEDWTEVISQQDSQHYQELLDLMSRIKADQGECFSRNVFDKAKNTVSQDVRFIQ